MTKRASQDHWTYRITQLRDVVSLTVGSVILLVDLYRDSWNPIGVTIAAASLGIVTTGQLGRWLLRNGNGK